MAEQALTPEQALARSIRYHRDVRLHITAKELAERIAKLGGSLSRQAISKIETEGRSVGIDELMFLARAMKMSPLLLLFPVGTATDQIGADIEIAGDTIDMWDAAKWFTGEGYLASEVNEHWALPLHLYRQHDRLVERLGELAIDDLWAPGSEHEKQDRERDRTEVVQRIRRLRGEITRHGLRLPVLPAGAEFIDEVQHRYLMPDDAEDLARSGRLSLNGRKVQPGEPTKLAEDVERARRFVAEYEAQQAKEQP